MDSGSDSQKQNVYAIFGEHSRELISPELALYMVETLCGQNSLYDRNTLNAILDQNRFLIVPVVNVAGKLEVENGNFCKRTNENGVDLNRNWGAHFKKHSNDDPDQFPGDHAFSEWQTIVLRNLLHDFKAKVFISIHSGALGMYSPPAYKIIDIKNMEKKFEKVRNLIKILNVLNEKYCHCKAGPAANELWYVCPGNCLDYAYEKEAVPYSFAFEIFTNENMNKFFKELVNRDTPVVFNYNEFKTNFQNGGLTSLFVEKHSSKMKSNFLQLDGLSADKIKRHSHTHDDESKYSCFAQTTTTYPRTNEFCLHQFNPLTKKERDNTVINWTNVIFELVSLIHELDHNNLS